MASSNFVPAIPLPPGSAAQSTNSVSLIKWNALCVSICLSISTVMFVLRSYVRVYIKRQWTLEDYMCCMSWIGLVIFCALMTVTTRKYGGIHEWDLSLPEVHEALHWFNMTSVEYAPAMLCTKVAVLLLYRRVFSPQRRSFFDIGLRLFITVLCLFYVSTALVKIWECNPRPRIWNKSIRGTCLDNSRVLETSGVFNLVTDIIILLVPVKAVWNMQLNTRRKVGVVLVFTVGLTAPVFSLIGTIVRIKVSSSLDVTYNQPLIQLWAAAEVSTGFICVCIPMLAALTTHRGPLKPSHSIINGESNSRRNNFSGRKQPTSLDEPDLFDSGDVELQHGRPTITGIGMPQMGVTTGIEGGIRIHRKQDSDHKTHDVGSADSSDELNETSKGTGIMTTVRIEQSYV